MKPTIPELYNPRVDQLRAMGFLAVAAVHFMNPRFQPALVENPVTNFLTPYINNGQFGVSLFFFLSGYILSRLAKAQGGVIDYKKFLYARLLRIYPLWILCIAIVMMTGGLKGGDVAALLALFTQNLPSSPFNVAWSVQTEMYLYLLFPLLFTNIVNLRSLAVLAGFCLLLRAMMYFIPPSMLRDLSYSTILGAVPLFALGVLTGKTASWNLGRWRVPAIVAACALIWCVGLLIESKGGFLQATTRLLWVFYPEVMGLCFWLLVRTYDSGPAVAPGPIGRFFAMVGKVSYSGYMLHVFVIDFLNHIFLSKIAPTIHPFLYFAIYLTILLPLAYFSYKVVEEPFLALRKRYVRPAAGEGVEPPNRPAISTDGGGKGERVLYASPDRG